MLVPEIPPFAFIGGLTHGDMYNGPGGEVSV
jgi:hypothetical protein